MKRTLVIAALGLASVSAFAQDARLQPQPSFNDNAPVASQPTTDTGTAIARQALPQPSFNDNAPIASDAVRTTTTSTDSASAAVPAPSFAG
jgi:hypothetical protein